MLLHLHRAPVLLASVLIAALGVSSALADPPTVLYRLAGESDYQEGCFGQCDCPVLLGQLEGTFALIPAGPSGGEAGGPDAFWRFAWKSAARRCIWTTIQGCW